MIPLVILGIIVVVGGCLMIYYQVGPTIRSRFTGGYGSAPRTNHTNQSNTFGGYIDVVGGTDSAADSSEEDEEDEPASDKVLYIFKGGQTELRPLDEKPENPDMPQGDDE